MSLAVVGAVLVAAVVAVLAFSEDVAAGQFKRMVGSLPNAGSFSAHASPRNTSTAMELDVYEFQTPAADAYRCGVTQNSTGQDLFVRLIGLTGTVLASCQTAVNGVCVTPFIGLGAGFVFQCTVSSGAGSPVTATAHYTFTVTRQ
jgi:hypothetical protein